MALLLLTSFADSTGVLRAVYEGMMQRPMPAVYRPGHGDAPGIIRAHSLDPDAMRLAFGFSGLVNGQGTLPWDEREVVNEATSRLNQCLY